MRNIFAFIVAGALLFAVLGCGLVSGLEDEAVNVAVGDSKVGIKECDEVIELLNEQVNNPDDGIIVKGVKRAALNQFREQLKQQLDQNQADRQQVAQFCTEFKKSLSEQTANSNSNRK